ncbi:MAG: hypothetical protein EBS41_07580, partial [Actinobacteria bacterium]|nr:hypothetical protein [Actinomycetota bacterium]
MPRLKQPTPSVSASICTVVSFGGSSRRELKIGMVHTDGCVATVTVLGIGKKGGTTFTPNQLLRTMFGTNGTKATEA